MIVISVGILEIIIGREGSVGREKKGRGEDGPAGTYLGASLGRKVCGPVQADQLDGYLIFCWGGGIRGDREDEPIMFPAQ